MSDSVFDDASDNVSDDVFASVFDDVSDDVSDNAFDDVFDAQTARCSSCIVREWSVARHPERERVECHDASSK